MAQNVNEFVKLLSSSNVQHQLASLMARDTILGNVDRVVMYMESQWSNLGNIMIAKGTDKKSLPRAMQSRIIAIDNELQEDLNNKPRAGYASFEVANEWIEVLGKNPALLVDRLLWSLAQSMNGAILLPESCLQNIYSMVLCVTALPLLSKEAAMREAFQGVITGPAPLPPTADTGSTPERTEAKKTDEPFYALPSKAASTAMEPDQR